MEVTGSPAHRHSRTAGQAASGTVRRGRAEDGADADCARDGLPAFRHRPPDGETPGLGLPTQRECLELLGCYGPGRVRKFAEIVAATVLCGEVSLGAAVVADEWVTAHKRFGWNRP